MHDRRSTRPNAAIGLDQGELIATPTCRHLRFEPFRSTTQEDVPPDPIARKQPRSRLSYCAQPLQTDLQCQGQLFRAGLVLLLPRKQERGFQVRQPRCHHEIVGSQFELQRLGFFDVD